MPADAVRCNRIFALQNVNVGSADGRRRDAEQRASGTDRGNWSLLELDLSCLDEDGGFHRCPRYRSWRRTLGGEVQQGPSLRPGMLSPLSPLSCSQVISFTRASNSTLDRSAHTHFRRLVRSFLTQSSLLSAFSQSCARELQESIGETSNQILWDDHLDSRGRGNIAGAPKQNGGAVCGYAASANGCVTALMQIAR